MRRPSSSATLRLGASIALSLTLPSALAAVPATRSYQNEKRAGGEYMGILGQGNVPGRNGAVNKLDYCRLWGHGSALGDNETVVIYGGMMTFKDSNSTVGRSDGETFFFSGYMSLEVKTLRQFGNTPQYIRHHPVTEKFISQVESNDQRIIARGLEYTLYPSVWAWSWENYAQLMLKFGGTFLPEAYWGEKPGYHKQTNPPRLWQAGLGGMFEGFEEVVPGEKLPTVRGDILGDEKWTGPRMRVEGAAYVSGGRLKRGWQVGGWGPNEGRNGELSGWEISDVSNEGGMWEIDFGTKLWKDLSLEVKKQDHTGLGHNGVGPVALAAVVNLDRGEKMGDGFLFLLGGVTWGDGYSQTGAHTTAGGSRRALANRDLTSVDVYDIANKRWYTQSTMGEAPQPRAGFCMVTVKRLEDGVEMGWDIYIFGGVTFGSWREKEVVHADVWLLSLPSFAWVKVHDGAGRVGRFEHTCHLVNYRNLLVIGGRGPSSSSLAGGNETQAERDNGVYGARDEVKGGWKMDTADMGCYGGPESWDGMTSVFHLTKLEWADRLEGEEEARKGGRYYLNKTLSDLPQWNDKARAPEHGWDDAQFAHAWDNGTRKSHHKEKSKVSKVAIVAPTVIGSVLVAALALFIIGRVQRKKKQRLAGTSVAGGKGGSQELMVRGK